MAVIDIGPGATDRAQQLGVFTFIDKANPANETGIIDTVEIWAAVGLLDCVVASFYVVSGDNLSTRSSVSIGSVTAGSKQTFSDLSLNVKSGDYLGIYYSSGAIEGASSGGSGVWYKAGNQIPCNNLTFSNLSSYVISIYGSGATAASGPANLKSYNTNLKANIKTINTNPIANVKSLNTNV